MAVTDEPQPGRRAGSGDGDRNQPTPARAGRRPGGSHTGLAGTGHRPARDLVLLGVHVAVRRARTRLRGEHPTDGQPPRNPRWGCSWGESHRRRLAPVADVRCAPPRCLHRRRARPIRRPSAMTRPAATGLARSKHAASLRPLWPLRWGRRVPSTLLIQHPARGRTWQILRSTGPPVPDIPALTHLCGHPAREVRPPTSPNGHTTQHTQTRRRRRRLALVTQDLRPQMEAF